MEMSANTQPIPRFLPEMEFEQTPTAQKRFWLKLKHGIPTVNVIQTINYVTAKLNAQSGSKSLI